MIPKSCRLFGQDHAQNQRKGWAWFNLTEKILDQFEAAFRRFSTRRLGVFNHPGLG
jgi:hypothetical protein